MSVRWGWWLAVCATTVGFWGCKGTSVVPDGGPIPINDPNLCSTRQKAQTVASCELTLGDALSTVPPKGGRFISVPGQKDWYSFTTPATATGQTLLHVTGGYSAPATPVNLEMNILPSTGAIPVLTGADQHGQAAPNILDLITPLASPNTQMFLTVQDDP